MKTPIRTRFLTLAALAGLSLAAKAGVLAPIVSLTGSNGGDQYANGMTSLTNGSGIDKSADPDDPSAWVLDGTAYQDEWMGWYMKDGGVFIPGLNGKLAWSAFDLGDSKPLIELWLFNNSYASGVSGVDTYNLYYADSPTVSLPAQPTKNTFASTGLTPQGDYDFSSGGWTRFNTSGPLGVTKSGINSVALTGITARYLAVEILSNHGDTYKGGRVGLEEVAVTVAPAVPTFGTIVPAGDVELSWTNPDPDSGSDVWVDVWFGTDPAALTKRLAAGLNTSSFTVNAPEADTYYWRLDHYLDGSSSGTPVTGPLWDFQVVDTDGDGMPDEFELAHTSPPSPTALAPGDDLENDGAGDGLTNLEEYQHGTDPTNAHSDNDTLEDGAEVAGAGQRPPTDPLDGDTDDDGLKDDAETNTDTWVSRTSTGTDPTNPDTDGDVLEDGVETNTGVYENEGDTGTDPLDPDSDGDNAGDWYEIAASFTDPTRAGDNPGIPYPLPDPDGSTGATDKPVKVYIMSGQSNMVAFGRVGGSVPGTLQTLTAENKFPNLVDGDGVWTVRDDVFYRGVISAFGDAELQPGFGADGSSFGPELGFGHVMGWYHDEPVLLIKSSIGNRSLSWDCLAPGSPSFDWTDGYTYAGYGQSPNRWVTGDGPTPFVWYAGKQYDDFFLDEADMGPALTWTDATFYEKGVQLLHNGVIYNSTADHTSSTADEPGVGGGWTTHWNVHSIFNVVDILDNWATEYAGTGKPFEGQDFEIAGFVWWQGHKDGGEQGAGTAGVAALHYEDNLVNLIESLRDYYEGRYPGKPVPDAPFVVATVGFSGGNWEEGSSADTIHTAQMAVGDPTQHPEFTGTVASVDTTGYWRDSSVSPTATGYHYNHNAETYLLTGDALGRAMVGMLEGGTTPPATDYDAWADNYPESDLEDPGADLTGNGLTNNEARIWGLDPTSNSAVNPISVPLDAGGTFTYTRRDPALSGLNYEVWTSTDLLTWNRDEGAEQTATADTPVTDVDTVSVEVSPELRNEPRLFVRMHAVD